MIDFSIFYSEQNPTITDKSYDFFISADDECDRTQNSFGEAIAKRKIFIRFPQQEYSTPNDTCYTNCEVQEDKYIQLLCKDLNILKNSKMCIDCTGFIIPHLLYLLGYLYRLEINEIDIIYNEPDQYRDKENTIFSKTITSPIPIKGFEAIASDIRGEEILIIETGFQTELIREVVRSKSKAAERHCIIGFPSLHADMYQHSLIQLNKAKNNIGSTRVEYHKAPAYDPFISANKIIEIIKANRQYKNNIFHISPLSTKPQAIGAALSYLLLNEKYPIDIIYPHSETYYSMNTIGTHRRWRYTIEFDPIRRNND